MAWQQPIVDRTEIDIKNKTNKAFLMAEDLNRIEGNLSFLSSKIKYTENFKTDWKIGDFVYERDFNRIYKALINIISAYEYKNGYIPTPPFNSFQKINQIEYLIGQIYLLK